MVILNLATAIICFSDSCYPALVGKDTLVGEYELHQRITQAPGYGGDILQFDETTTEVFAIHRLWLLRPAEHRERRIKSESATDRVITKGCVNVEPEVYERLVECCSNDHLSIRR